MVKHKEQARGSLQSSSEPQAPRRQLNGAHFFPFARYTSIVGVHTTLLTFTALFLPRTTFLSDLTKPSLETELRTSRDRPQHWFLEDLTISPVSTLLCICAGVFLLQGWWAGWMRLWWIEYVLEGSDDEKRLEKLVIDKRKMIDLKNAWLLTSACSIILHIILVLFGAPITSHVAKTYLLSLLISLLVVFSPAYSLCPPNFNSSTQSVTHRLLWVRLFAEFSLRSPIERAFVYPAVGTLLGCWAGTIPIALDWDRPWQAWPLTPAYGAILGYILASVSAVAVNATLHLADEHVRTLEADKKSA